MTVYDIEASRLDGHVQSLADYRGKVLLIVNTASKCGFTPQYKGLQDLYTTYRDRGLEVLGFPCDQFMHQEPGGDAEIAAFCEKNYGVTFPMFAKIAVNGPDAHPLYKLLKRAAGGWFGSAIKWNFTKFLVRRDGTVEARFPPTTAPASIAPKVEALLAR